MKWYQFRLPVLKGPTQGNIAWLIVTQSRGLTFDLPRLILNSNGVPFRVLPLMEPSAVNVA